MNLEYAYPNLELINTTDEKISFEVALEQNNMVSKAEAIKSFNAIYNSTKNHFDKVNAQKNNYIYQM